MDFFDYLSEAFKRIQKPTEQQIRDNRPLFNIVASTIERYFMKNEWGAVAFYAVDGDRQFQYTRNHVYMKKTGAFTGIEIVTFKDLNTVSIVYRRSVKNIETIGSQFRAKKMLDYINSGIKNALNSIGEVTKVTKLDTNAQYGYSYTVKDIDYSKGKYKYPNVRSITGKSAASREVGAKKQNRDEVRNVKTNDQKIADKLENAKVTIAAAKSAINNPVFSKIADVVEANKGIFVHRDKFRWRTTVDYNKKLDRYTVNININFYVAGPHNIKNDPEYKRTYQVYCGRVLNFEKQDPSDMTIEQILKDRNIDSDFVDITDVTLKNYKRVIKFIDEAGDFKQAIRDIRNILDKATIKQLAS